MRSLLLIFVLLCFLPGCSGKYANETARRLEPTESDMRIIWLEGIADPYSRRGQQRLRQLRQERQLLEEARRQRREAIQSRQSDR